MSISRRNRRGAAAIEFALVSVPMVALLSAAVDYGLFFSQQGTVLQALRDGARAGAIVSAADGETGCLDCEAQAEAVALAALADNGITASPADLTITIIPVDTTCAVSVETSLTPKSMLGFVPVPSSFGVKATSFAPSVPSC